MDLISLHATMSQSGYNYFGGSTNDTDNLYIDFSTVHNGRGDWFEFRIGREDNDIKFRDESGSIVEHTKISDSQIIGLINNRIGGCMSNKSVRELMRESGYSHFNGSAIEEDGRTLSWYSTEYRGRGDWFKIRVGPNNNDISFNDSQGFHPIKISRKNVSDSEMLELINERVKKN